MHFWLLIGIRVGYWGKWLQPVRALDEVEWVIGVVVHLSCAT